MAGSDTVGFLPLIERIAGGHPAQWESVSPGMTRGGLMNDAPWI